MDTKPNKNNRLTKENWKYEGDSITGKLLPLAPRAFQWKKRKSLFIGMHACIDERERDHYIFFGRMGKDTNGKDRYKLFGTGKAEIQNKNAKQYLVLQIDE